MASTSVLINVGAATSGAVTELAKVDKALAGNKAAVEKASAAVQAETGRMSASMAAMAADVKKSSAKAESSLHGVGDGADTVASKGAQAAGALSGLGQLIGGPFGGAMQGAGVAMQAAADAGDLLNVAVEGGRKAAAAARTALTAFSNATGLSSAATKIAAAAQWALNAAMTANPIGLVIAAIALLVAGMIIAYKKSETFRNIVNGAFQAVKDVAVGVFAAVEGAIEGAIGKLRDLWRWLSDLGGKVRDVLSKIPGVGRAAAAVGVTYDSPAMAAATRADTRDIRYNARPVVVTEEQVYRAVSRLIMRGDGRNGLAVGVI